MVRSGLTWAQTDLVSLLEIKIRGRTCDSVAEHLPVMYEPPVWLSWETALPSSTLLIRSSYLDVHSLSPPHRALEIPLTISHDHTSARTPKISPLDLNHKS